MKLKSIAKAVVLNHQGEVLLLRRSQTDNRRPGEWDFPGGGVDPGEDLAQATAREIQEEAGITVEIGSLELIYANTEIETQRPGNESITRLLFLCHIDEVKAASVVLSYEHDLYVWVSVEKALQDFQHSFYNQGLRYAFENGMLEN